MKRIITICLFVVSCLAAMSQTNLATYEYWFNHDFESRQSHDIAPSSQNKLLTAIDVGSLPNGVNLLNIRYIDENGLASSPVCKMFYKNTQLLNVNNRLSRYEYWFNHDFESRQSLDIAPSQQIKLISAIDVSSLAEGVNVMNIRYFDENGLASSTVSKMFYKPSVSYLQNKKLLAYEYWFNNDIENRVETVLPPANNQYIVSAIDVSALSEGLNVFNVRYKDETGTYSSTLYELFYRKSLSQITDNSLAAYEYWFNNDYENRVEEAFTPAANQDLLTNIDAAALSEGLNVLNIRFKDENGIFSTTMIEYFYRKPLTSVTNNRMVAYEYWFNNDYENRVEEVLTPAANQDLLTNIDAAALTEGLNVFNIRFKDENDAFSTTLTEYFYRTPLTTVSSNRMVAYEYWLNNDYENRVEEAFTPAANQDLLTNIDASALTEGLNVFNIRFKDEKEAFSSTMTEFFYKNPHGGLSSNKIYAYRYRIEDENGTPVGQPLGEFTRVNLDEPANPAVINVDLEVHQLTMGNYAFVFETLDSLGLWSATTTDIFEKTAFPVAQFLFDNNLVCSNVPIQFINQSIDADTCLWDFGDGHTSNEYEPEHIFEMAGQYEVFLIATDSLTGRDSTISRIIEVLPSAFSDETHEICQGDTLLWNGFEYFETGDYDVVLAAANGCDSTVTLHLTVNPTYDVFYTDENTILDYRVNDSFEDVPVGELGGWVIKYNGTGNANQKVIDTMAKNGSKSLQLEGTSSWAAELTKPITDLPEKLIIEGWVNAEKVLSGLTGGMDLVNPDGASWGARVSRLQFFGGRITTSYYPNGQTYDIQSYTPGVWYHLRMEHDLVARVYAVFINGIKVTGTSGSVTTDLFPMHPTINPTQFGIFAGNSGTTKVFFDDLKMYEGSVTSICSTELPFVFGSQNLTESGQYSETFQTVHGCDSIVTINLEVKQAYDLYETIDLCQSELPYNFGTQTLTETGVYTESWPLPNGCDSTITLDFTVHPEYDIEARKAICIDSTYRFGTQLITEAGVYEEMFESEFGCDSLVTLTVQTVPGNIGVFDTTFVSPADECFNGFYTITVAGDGYPVTVESGAFANYIAGQSIHFKPGFHARSGSYINAYITTEPWYCDQASQAIVLASPTPEPFTDKSFEISDFNIENENLLEQSMKVFPNPNNGQFTITFDNFDNETKVFVYNTFGQKVYQTSTWEKFTVVELQHVRRGIYFVKAVNNQRHYEQKIIVQ